jgi:exopolyphosphatase/guanosine-5'-triphosphate,3'-diphosphate pyrophosphatase
VTPPSAAVAAIDIGTNSTRLLVGDERRAVITRLGQGVERTGRLDEAAIERTLEVLREYAGVLRAMDVDRVRAVATSAARDAANRDAFLDPAAEILGVPIELLSGEDEGRLAYLGATAGLDPSDGPFLVFDIGGGSTEFALEEAVLSIDTGAVRLTEQWLHSDPPTAEELSMAVSVVRAHLEDVTRELPGAKSARTVVGLAGTVTTVAAVELGFYDHDAVHGMRLTRAQVEDVFRTLATEPLEDRRQNPGLQPERADIIVGGCCILVAVLRHLEVDELLVSEADILDGLLHSMRGGTNGA